jgi:(R,R)-butanediol dehydrogenase / meso-butanediol dehydrogenase / diacetyl reductase
VDALKSENLAIVVRLERDAPVREGSRERYRWPQLAIESRPLGRLAPDAIRVRMLVAGVCGTDLHLTRPDPATGSIECSAPFEVGADGRVLGHEGVGQIAELGEAVRGFRVGDVVTFESIVTCQECVACRRGQFNQCRFGRLIGAEVDGLFREMLDVPARIAHDVSDLARTPEGLRAVACIEPAACAHVAITRLAVRPGERVLVFGAGPLGLYAAMLCRDAFGASVEVVEPVAGRREIAAAWSERTYDVEEFFADSSGDPFDVVIEASGELENVDRVFRRVGPCGRLGLLARRGRPLRVESVDHLISNGISIVGSRGHLGGAFADVLGLRRAGRLPLERSVTGTVEGLDGLRREMLSPEPFEHRHVKMLARLGDAA